MCVIPESSGPVNKKIVGETLPNFDLLLSDADGTVHVIAKGLEDTVPMHGSSFFDVNVLDTCNYAITSVDNNDWTRRCSVDACGEWIKLSVMLYKSMNVKSSFHT